MSGFGESASAMAAWLGTPDPVYRRNRLLAFSCLPMLVVPVAKDSTEPTFMAMAASIDRGDPLVESISDIMGVKKDAVRFLIAKGPELVGEKWLERPRSLLRALEIAPSNSLPESCEDWAAFQLYWDSSNCSGFLTEHFFKELCSAGYGADMAVTRQRLAICANSRYDINDYLRFVEDGWLRRQGNDSRWGDHPSTAELLLMRYPAAELARQLLRWQQLVEAEEAAGTKLSPEFFYPVSDPDSVMRQVLPDYESVWATVSELLKN